MTQSVVGEMEMHSVANLATLQIPLVTFCPFKKAPKPYFVSENRRYCSVRSCFPSTRLSLSLCASARFSSWGAVLSVKHRYYVASLVLHDESIAEITPQLLSLSYVYLISSGDGSVIMIFVQMNILEGENFLCSLNGSHSVTISIHSVVWQKKQ